MSETPVTLGPYALLGRLAQGEASEERFVARRVANGDIGGPVIVTRYPAADARKDAWLSSWCEMAHARERAGHAGVVRCLEVGVTDAYIYEVSELADGVTLAALLERYHQAAEHPPLDVALSVACALASLFKDLHARASLIGYAKPQGVILTWDGRVVLERLGAPDATSRDMDWAAPELLREAEADSRTDVWVVGRLFKSVLMGHEGKSARVPARYAQSTKVLLRGLLTTSRRKRHAIEEALQAIEGFLVDIGAPSPQILLASVMAERFVERRPLDDSIDLSTLRRLGRQTKPASRLFPPDRDGAPADAQHEHKQMVNARAQAHAPPSLVDEESESTRLTDSVSEGDSAASSDEGPDVDVADVFSDPFQPVRTQVTTLGLSEEAHKALGADSPHAGPLKEAEADSSEVADAASGGQAVADERSSTEHAPSATAIGEKVEAGFSFSWSETGAGVDAEGDATQVEERKKGAEEPSAETYPAGSPGATSEVVKTAAVMARTAPSGLGMVSENDVWADASPAPAVGLLSDATMEMVSTEVVGLPDASVSEIQSDVVQGASPASKEGPPQSVSSLESAVFTAGSARALDGVLVVDAPEHAVVFIDGEEKGSGRLSVQGVPRAGTIRIRVTLSGHRPWLAEVSLDGNLAAKVTPRLVPAA